MSTATCLVPLAIHNTRGKNKTKQKNPTGNKELSTKIAIIKPIHLYSLGRSQNLTEPLTFFLTLFLKFQTTEKTRVWYNE